MRKVYTFGYALYSDGVKAQLKEMGDMLRAMNVKLLADLRGRPFSRIEEFSEGRLERWLNSLGIRYLSCKKGFGARSEDESMYTDGIIDFSKLSHSSAFEQKMNELLGVVKESGSESVALMCAEIDPLTCHRTWIACELEKRGVPVTHLIPGEEGLNFTPHSELMKRMDSEYENLFEPAFSVWNQKIGFQLSEMKKNRKTRQNYMWNSK